MLSLAEEAAEPFSAPPSALGFLHNVLQNPNFLLATWPDCNFYMYEQVELLISET
jgi:hypothetical protein